MAVTSTEFKYCPYCSAELPPQEFSGSQKCLKCQKTVSSSSGRNQHFEYKSRLHLFGWPLVHVNSGKNPETGKPGIARGMLAFGDVAIGGIAVGGVAIGGMALGGVAVGLLTLAGCSFGLLFAIGGMAIGCGLSLGGVAIGSIAVGGLAVGIYSVGGLALGLHTMGGMGADEQAVQFFRTWRTQLGQLVGQVGPFLAFAILAPMLSVPFIRRMDDDQDEREFVMKKTIDPDRDHGRSFLGLLICLILGGAIGVGSLWLIAVLIVSF